MIELKIGQWYKITSANTLVHKKKYVRANSWGGQFYTGDIIEFVNIHFHENPKVEVNLDCIFTFGESLWNHEEINEDEANRYYIKEIL